MLTGTDIVKLAKTRIGDRYVYGAFVPKDDPNANVFDCAELCSWAYYQVSQILFGTSNHKDPKTADAWTGFWKIDGGNSERGKLIPVADAAAIPGAAVLRIGTNQASGHIVLSDGSGGTVEAHSTASGVIASTLDNRRWSTGILVNGVEYTRNPQIIIEVPKFVYRLTSPMVRGQGVESIQNALIRNGYRPGAVDGFYGSQTFNAVIEFQEDNGMLVDGEVGPATWNKLGFGTMK